MITASYPRSWPAAIFVEKKQPPRENTTVFSSPGPAVMALAGGGIGSPTASGPAFGPAAKQPRPPKIVGPFSVPSGRESIDGTNPNSPAPKGPAFGPVVISKSVRNGEKSSSVESRNLLLLLQ